MYAPVCNFFFSKYKTVAVWLVDLDVFIKLWFNNYKSLLQISLAKTKQCQCMFYMHVRRWIISLLFQRMERDLHSFSEPFIFHFMPFFNQTKCTHHLNGPLNLTLQRECDTRTINLSQRLQNCCAIWLEMPN